MALRFANVYGPWSARKKGAMTTFFKAIHAGEPIVIYGDGSASRGQFRLSRPGTAGPNDGDVFAAALRRARWGV